MISSPKVTIAIPTYNRSRLLKISLKSALEQDYPNFDILVLDNASTDDTNSVVRSFSDTRITYICNETNIGIFRNWNRVIELNSSPYLNILQDDDEMLPGFISESISALEKNPRAAFSFAQVRGVDINGATVPLSGDAPNEGVISGLEYLHQIVAGRNWIIRPSTVMMRSSALAAVGPFDTVHSSHALDLNLYLRIAAHYDLNFIPKVLGHVRVHTGQDTQLRFRTPGGTGPLTTMSERTDAAAYLLRSERAEDAVYRRWLADRLLHISMQRSELTQQLLPGLTLTWAERLEIVKREISSLIPTDDSFILVDENKWGIGIFSNHDVTPFLEQNKLYWGPPPDSETAIKELKRLWKSGANFIVFGWPAFWWIDYYSEFRDYLYSNFPCIVQNSRIIVFDIRP